jgi:3-methyladenine DNA glycosylase AlkD
MTTAGSILAELKAKGKEQYRKIYARHGLAVDRVYGVSVADMKVIAKTIKKQQGLALELYATGIMDAMYLAGMVADGRLMSRELLNEWAEGAAGMQMIAEYTVPWVTVESPHARELALEWMRSEKEYIAAAGWSTYCGLVALMPDEALDLAEIESLLETVVEGVSTAQNRVRYTMNTFVIAVGSYVKPLVERAKAVARQIGSVKVDMGETECEVPLAIRYIEKVEGMGRIGRKRKTIRC